MLQKNKYLIVFGLIFTLINAQNFPLKFSRADASPNKQTMSNHCETRVKVKDERPNNCNFGGNVYLYQVLLEDFNYREDLPNNWKFNLGYTKDDFAEAVKDGQTKGMTWMAEPEGGYGNVSTAGGIGYFSWEQENVVNAQANPTVQAKTYNFTGADLYSIFKLREGVFEARIKLPENNLFWPAYWLFEDPREIDVFEFFDPKITGSPCDTYHQMKMTLHNHKLNGHHCERGRKFPVPQTFFDNFHIYKCVWTDYRVEIYLDGTLVGYGTRYYDGPYIASAPCLKHAPSGIPHDTRDCNYMANSNSCNAYYPWPFNDECAKWNLVDKDQGFPTTDLPMSIIVSNALNYNMKNTDPNAALLSSWNSLIPTNKRVEIDWIKIYQPFYCNNDRYLCSLQDFLNDTEYTNFLSGSTIRIAPYSNCSFVNQIQNQSDSWRERPMHILASNEISIEGEAAFEEGTFLRAEIVDCAGGFNQYQRGGPSDEPLFLTDEEIQEIERKQNDSLLLANPSLQDEVQAYENSKYGLKSEVDNGAITLYPNPSSDYIIINMDEEDFSDLKSVEIIDILGRKQIVEKSPKIDIKNLISGIYQIKFIFSFGHIVVKSFVKE